MALEYPVIDVDMTGGLNTKSDAVDVLAPDLIDLQNCIYTRPGAFARRQGSAQINPVTSALTNNEGNQTIIPSETISSVTGMYPGRQSPLIANANGMYAYDSVSGQMCRVSQQVPTYLTAPVIDSTVLATYDGDMAVGGGYVLYAFSNSGGVHVSLYDQTTQQVVKQYDLVGYLGDIQAQPVYTDVRVLYVNGHFVVGYRYDSVSRTLGDVPEIALFGIKLSDMSLSNYSLQSTTTNLHADSSGSTEFSMDALTSDTYIYYGYRNAANSIVVGRVPVPFASPNISNTTVTTATDFVIYRFQGGASKFGCLWNNGATTTLRVHDTSNVATFVTNSVGASTGSGGIGVCNYAPDSGTTMYLAVSGNGAIALYSYNYTGPSVSAVGTISIGAGTQTSRMHYFGGKAYFAAYYTANKILLMRLYDARNAGYPTAMFPVAGWGDTRYTTTLSTTQKNRPQRHICGDATNNILYITDLFRVNPADVTNSLFSATSYQCVSVQFENSDLIGSYAEFGGSTVIASGLPLLWTGAEVVEAGFLAAPVVTVTPNLTGSGLPAGTYLYKFVYAWTDGTGRVHRSATSVSVSGTLSGTGKFDFSATGILPTLKSAVNIEVYRTTIGSTGPYYFDQSIYFASGVSTTGSDSVLDAVISANRQLYTSGGVFDNDIWPAMGAMRTYQNRLFAIDTEHNNIVFSKSNTSTEGPAISLLNVQAPGSYTERKYALGVIDQSILCFARDKTYINAGEPPNDQGQGSTMGSWQLTQAETGCMKPKAVAPVPEGILVMTEKGIYLYDRTATATYVGAPVEAYNGQGINNAVLVTAGGRNQVRFTCSSAQSGDYQGLVLVYDTFIKRWSRFTYASRLTGQICVAGKYWFSQNNGAVRYEREVTDTNYGDSVYGSSTVYGPPCYIRIGWVPMGGTQNWGRVRRVVVMGVADWSGSDAASITCQFFNDYADAAVSTATVVPSSSGVLSGDTYQFRIRTAYPKLESFSVGLSIPLSNNGAAAMNITGIALETGMKKGAVKLPATKTFSTS